MAIQLKEKISQLVQIIAMLGKVGLLVVENEEDRETVFTEAPRILLRLPYQQCADYLEIMNALSVGKDKIFYVEREEKLNGLVLEIIAEFESGIVSLADRKNNTGLKIAKWNPAKTSFIVIMTRDQVEKSYPRLFEYINITQSI